MDRCQAYHSVERQHGVAHLNPSPDLRPEEPIIHINLVDLPEGGSGVEWDVQSCNSFQEEKGRWLRLRPGEELPK